MNWLSLIAIDLADSVVSVSTEDAEDADEPEVVESVVPVGTEDADDGEVVDEPEVVDDAVEVADDPEVVVCPSPTQLSPEIEGLLQVWVLPWSRKTPAFTLVSHAS